MKSKTLMVSQHLDSYKNNGLIYNLHEILSGQIWVCYLTWFLVNHGFILWPEIFMVYTGHTGEFITIGYTWTTHLYFTNEAHVVGIKQWTVRDMPNFEDLIPKLGWIFWAII